MKKDCTKGNRNQYYTGIIQQQVAELFELATIVTNKMPLDDFAVFFANSFVAKAFEDSDSIIILGNSSIELLAKLFDEEPKNVEVSSSASPEFWVGWVLGYAQTTLRKSYKTLIKVFPCSELINYYFPYHEMDINHIIDVFKERLQKYSPLKEIREKIGLSQDDLSIMTDIPVRTIRAYEQNKLDIRKAQADTVYILAKTLKCSIDYLMY